MNGIIQIENELPQEDGVASLSPNKDGQRGDISVNGDKGAVAVNSDKSADVAVNGNRSGDISVNSDKGIAAVNSSQSEDVAVNGSQSGDISVNGDKGAVAVNSDKSADVAVNGDRSGDISVNSNNGAVAVNSDKGVVAVNSDKSEDVAVNGNKSGDISVNGSQSGYVSVNNSQSDVPFIQTELMEQEYAREGCLSEESYSILEKVGISRHVAQMYIEGQKAIAAAQVAEIMNVAGGEKQYKAMTLWAAENLSDSEKDVFNNAVSGSDKELAKFAVGGLRARYLHAMGFEPMAAVEGVNAPWQHGYESLAEMVRDVADPRYKNDEAYRRKVAAKAARSRF